jgi:hypothetical protein
MTRNIEYQGQPEVKTAWSVVVIYEDITAREQAVDFCDQLVRRFWARFEFDVSWWSFALLEKATVALEAANQAARANLVIFSSVRSEQFPAPVTGWIESWLGRRGDREGILAGLVPSEPAEGRVATNPYYLRQVAHRAGMDYLTQVPPNLLRSIPESLEFYAQRAVQVTSVLDEILHQQALPPVPT